MTRPRVTVERVDDELDRVWIDPTPDGYASTDGGILVPEHYVAERAAVAVDLFAGCGGMSLGIEATGEIEVLAAVEWDETAAMTYAFNLGAPGGRFAFGSQADVDRFLKRCRQERIRRDREHARMSPRRRRDLKEWGYYDRPFADEPPFFGWNRARLAEGCPPLKGQSDYVAELNAPIPFAGPGCRSVIVADVRELEGAQIVEEAGIEDGVDIVVGGPPCQGFSTAGRQNPLDPRNNLVLEFLRLVGELRPKAFCMENVPPLLTGAKFKPLRDAWFRRAKALGYDVVANVLDACDYGVPQRRRRAFFVGQDADRATRPFQFPPPSTWPIGRPAHGKGWSQGFAEEDD